MSNCCSPNIAALSSSTHRALTTVPQLSPIQSANADVLDDFVSVPAGSFQMGDHGEAGYEADGETPVHEVRLSSFFMSESTVTNQGFEVFVKDTGYVTTAELLGFSAVFYAAFQGPTTAILQQVRATPWWLAVQGADWRHPNGPSSSIDNIKDHPVVHVSWHDAIAYCAWRGGRLPTEAEWEYAARGGLRNKQYVWGNSLTSHGHWICNIWQGEFPHTNTADDGYLTTAPVKTYEPNGYGLWQMAGNVWEWCHDWFAADYYSNSEIFDPLGPEDGTQRVMRGGSYLCHDSYCNRYRVSARSSNTPDSASANIGFRCVIDPPGQPVV